MIVYHNKGYLAYSTLLCLICTSQVLKQRIDKAFYIFDKIKVPLRLDNISPRRTYPVRLDDISPRRTYPAKDTTENAILQKSTLANAKCKFKFNILIYSQRSDLLTYFEIRGRVYTKVAYFLNFKWDAESLSLFSFQFDTAFKLSLISTFLQILSICNIYQYERFIFLIYV